MSAINVDTIRSRTGTAPQLDKGVEVTVGVAITGSGGVNVSGFATAGGFVGDITGDVTGDVTGNVAGDVTGNISGIVTATTLAATGISTVGIFTSYATVTVGTAITADATSGIITATDFVGGGSQLTGLPAGFTELDAALFN